MIIPSPGLARDVCVSSFLLIFSVSKCEQICIHCHCVVELSLCCLVVIVLCYRLSVVIVLCYYLCCSVIMVLFYVLIVCTVTLPPGVNSIAVDKYIYLSISISTTGCHNPQEINRFIVTVKRRHWNKCCLIKHLQFKWCK